MNRESKRMMERRGRTETDAADLETDTFELGDLGPARREARPVRSRTSPVQFAREIRDELRQVAWPTRVEMVNYSMVVFFTLVIMVALIFLLNLAFGKGVYFMFQK
ncbi:MAG: preprotein translocase subunit SecE [Actinomycetota bacterium]|nr:preprotein translocase subunit SecE [Actinomycetota bacterium]